MANVVDCASREFDVDRSLDMPSEFRPDERASSPPTADCTSKAARTCCPFEEAGARWDNQRDHEIHCSYHDRRPLRCQSDHIQSDSRGEVDAQPHAVTTPLLTSWLGTTKAYRDGQRIRTVRIVEVIQPIQRRKSIQVCCNRELLRIREGDEGGTYPQVSCHSPADWGAVCESRDASKFGKGAAGF